MALDPDSSIFKVFNAFIRAKMPSLAIPAAGVAVSLPVMTASKMFEYPVGNIMEWAGLTVMLLSLALFSVSSTVLT
jgi:hypothetical protein